MKYNTVIFDFDGTIADSEQSMLRAINTLAEEFRFKPLLDAEIPTLRRMSARTFIRRRLHMSLWNPRRLLRFEKRSREEFEKRTEKIKAFPGMIELLSKLRAAGRQVGIVSSSQKDSIDTLLGENDTAVDFIRAEVGMFRKAQAIKKVLKQYKINKGAAVYVGDELRDAGASRRAGIPMIGVGWGLNDTPSLVRARIEVASTPEELFSMITRHQ